MLALIVKDGSLHPVCGYTSWFFSVSIGPDYQREIRNGDTTV